MKVLCKTLSRDQFTLEVTPSQTVLEVKKMIEGEKGFDAAHQKLVYKGKILADAETLESYGVADGEFFVVMATKKVAQAKPKPASVSSSSSSSAPTPAPMDTTPANTAPPPSTTTTTATTATATTVAPSPTPTPPAAAAPGPEAMVTGASEEGAVQTLMALGFPRDQCEVALRAAFNNPDRAVDYLLNGIPPELMAQMAAGGTPAQPQTGSAEVGGVPNEAGGDDGGDDGEMTEGAAFTAALRAMPPFTRLRYAVQQNPALMQPMLQQLGQTQPQLLQLISAHQDEFLALMNEPVTEAEMAAASAATDQMNQELGGVAGGMGAPPPGVNYIQVTEEEKGHIEQLEALGFPRHICVQAYMSCNKDPDLAANFLFSYGADMVNDEAQGQGQQPPQGQ
ncbi:UV excision repair protein Rad23 [Thecamonas trahens ATCC 50062]|uniref:UV excision repair protein RAD23 n=1 Tax=Thecamonas trahens ATCC 50062 TaxID=461836 RepID=A0A0L0DEU6_THETB|nr:UV excision repair protein Rad23 [Thecamonas trahens ATCC 50062]KNC50857.1 UV excision repair protein Rad23 [Thecamonas trahens ATCC 50062]|eukprot:XP_013756809.1 UV excision repair protein Rad23 [Thecamonas trahens ATCC 50062]